MSVASQDGVAWRRRKDLRQPEILAAARKLIEEEGAAATSVARIAQAAGVSEATVYKYFESKQDLVNQVMHQWATPFIDRLLAELDHVSGIRSRLTLIAIRFLRSLDETPKLHRVFFQELRWSDYRGSPLHQVNHSFASTVTAAVEEGIKAGEIRSGVDPAMLRDMLFGGLEHIGLRTSFAGRPIDVEDYAARYVDLMLKGILIVENAASDDAIDRLGTLVTRLERTFGDTTKA